MDARLSPEQVALRDSAAQVVARLGVRAVGQLKDAERAGKLDAAIAAAGWRDLRAASDAGGPWASAVEAAIIAEEVARGLGDAPFVGPTLAAELRRLIAAPPASAPETVALDARFGGLASAGDDAVAIDAAGCASALLLFGSDADASLATAELNGGRTAVDLTRPSTAVPAGAAVVGVDAARPFDADACARWTALGLALTCADLVGTMRGAVALATDYAAQRRQYGVPVGSFQAVQHLLADALVATEGSRSVALHAAWAVDALAPAQALAAGAVAKAYSARAARTVCETAIQVHGGIGNTWECLAHVYLRRALLSIDLFGSVGANLARVLAHHGIGDAHGLR